ncbi:MAG: hypothetical protein HYX69_03620 [Planctomycetia bacterium]|nr:hypothetical protein [Planctomycetia bacterium]
MRSLVIVLAVCPLAIDGLGQLSLASPRQRGSQFHSELQPDLAAIPVSITSRQLSRGPELGRSRLAIGSTFAASSSLTVRLVPTSGSLTDKPATPTTLQAQYVRLQI